MQHNPVHILVLWLLSAFLFQKMLGRALMRRFPKWCETRSTWYLAERSLMSGERSPDTRILMAVMNRHHQPPWLTTATTCSC